jgi:hypothetical protein
MLLRNVVKRLIGETVKQGIETRRNNPKQRVDDNCNPNDRNGRQQWGRSFAKSNSHQRKQHKGKRHDSETQNHKHCPKDQIGTERPSHIGLFFFRPSLCLFRGVMSFHPPSQSFHRLSSSQRWDKRWDVTPNRSPVRRQSKFHIAATLLSSTTDTILALSALSTWQIEKSALTHFLGAFAKHPSR